MKILISFLVLVIGFGQTANSQTWPANFPGQHPGKSVMLPSYVESVAQFAYIWGWPMVNLHNRQQVFNRVPTQGYLGGVMPVAPVNKLTMLTSYASPGQKDVAHPNQDVVYGFGIMDLDKSPVIIQVPDFGERFWMYQLADQRTDSYGKFSKVYNTRPGFYLIVPEGWNGKVPEGINEVIISPTALSVIVPRVFMDDTEQDRDKAQGVISRIAMYPLCEYDGKMKITKWESLPVIPEPQKTDKEKAWVNPDTFFDVLPAVLQEVPPMKGEETLYAMFTEILEAAKKNPEYKQLLVHTARRMENELIDSLFFFNNVGVETAHYWTRPFNNGAFGYDYLTRVAIAKSNIFTNHFREAAYFYQYRDESGERLDASRDNYTITFAKNELPPVDGFWSITMYDEHHFFHHNELGRYSMGTKSKSMRLNPDGSLTLYLQNKKPEKDKIANWLPAPDGKFAVTIRAYAPRQAIIDGAWNAPAVKKKNITK